MSFSYVCPKCGVSFTDDLEWDDVARAHAMDWRKARIATSVCMYVICDDPTCRALRAPVTLEELRAALTHWEHHAVDGGCSHGC